MGAAPAAGKAELQQMLQSAVQAVQWTYIIFWRFCPQQGALVWSEGYYNGAIKTRKTVQPMEVTAEEASLERSQQLRELYDALSAEEANPHQQPPKRPSAALSPEDLTETEWFYLMCVSFSFAPAVGLPGKAYVKRQHVWLTGAHEVDSKVFSRAILAKSARVQTVVCIPVMDGVVELGSTERLKEDPSLVQHVKSLFVEQRRLPPSKPVPTLSEQSTSNPAVRFPIYSPGIHQLNEEDNHDNGNGKFNGGAVERDSGVGQQGPSSQAHVAAELSELMQVEMSEDIRLGSPDSPTRCPLLHHHHLQLPPPSASGVGVMEEEELAGEEDTHYSQTVSSILQYQTARRWAQVSPAGASTVQSAFSKWTPGAAERDVHLPDAHTSQSLLKYILLSVPFLHSTSCKESPIEKSSNHGNHVLAERRRREKLNERFIILRSLVPFVTKMDKASILADTIDYLKHLRRKINELEARAPKPNNTSSGLTLTERAQPQSKSCGSAKPKPAPAPAQADMLQVSIIEIDALIELQCPYREGLLLDIMVVLREMHLEVTAVNSSFSNSFFTAHLRAKVRENVNGKKASIVQVKTAIAQIVPHSHHL